MWNANSAPRVQIPASVMTMWCWPWASQLYHSLVVTMRYKGLHSFPYLMNLNLQKSKVETAEVCAQTIKTCEESRNVVLFYYADKVYETLFSKARVDHSWKGTVCMIHPFRKKKCRFEFINNSCIILRWMVLIIIPELNKNRNIL